MIRCTAGKPKQHDQGEGKDVAPGSPSRNPGIWFRLRRPSLLSASSRTVLGVKGSLRRGPNRRALDSCAPFRGVRLATGGSDREPDTERGI